MAVNNKPQDDSRAMTDEYNKGTPINELADKYNHSVDEVEMIVTKPVTDEPQTNLPTQAELESKKGK